MTLEGLIRLRRTMPEYIEPIDKVHLSHFL